MGKQTELCVNFCTSNDLIPANTWVEKPSEKLVTFSFTGDTDRGPPYNADKYSQVDYVLTKTRWRNAIKYIETDIRCPIDSDHFPLSATIRVKFQKQEKLNKKTASIPGTQNLHM